jgi:hypothetical protein
MLLADLIYQDLQMLCVAEEPPKRQVEAAAAVLSRLVPSSQGFEVAVGNIVSSLSSSHPDGNAIRTATDRVIEKLMSVGSQPR